MSEPHVHLCLPESDWTIPGFSWCLRLIQAQAGKSVPMTDVLAHVTCPRCQALSAAAQAEQGHPLHGYAKLGQLQKAVLLDCPAAVAYYCRPLLVHQSQQVTFCLMAIQRLRILHTQELFRGTLEQSLWHPREIFATVLRYNAYGFVLVHNHPCGDPAPQEAERTTIGRLIRCSKLMQIPFLDHIIVARQGYYSLRERTSLWDEV